MLHEQALHERGTESSQLDTDIDSLNKALQRLSTDPVSLKEETSAHVSDEEETEQHDEEKLEKFLTVVVLDKVEIIITEQVSDQVVVEENRVADKMVSVEVLPSPPVLDNLEITTDQVSDQVVVEENRVANKMVSVEVLLSAPVLENLEIATDQVSDLLQVDEGKVDEIVGVEVSHSVPVLDKVEIKTDQATDKLGGEKERVVEETVGVMELVPPVPVLEEVEISTDQVSDVLEVEDSIDEIVTMEVLPSVALLDKVESTTDQASDEVVFEEDRVADEIVSLEVSPSVSVLYEVSDHVEIDEESLLRTGSIESLTRALDELEMENATDPMFSPLKGDQGFVCESITVDCFTPSVSKTMENTTDKVSCQLKVDGENLVATGRIKSLTARFDEIAEAGSSYVFETKSIEPTTPCLFSKAMQNTTDKVLCQFEVDGESLVETGSIESLTAGYDEIAEPGSSYIFETKTVEPTTSCLFSKTMQNTTDQVLCQFEVDGESLVETGSIESLTAGYDEIAEPGSSYVFETKTVEPTTSCLFSKTMQIITDQVLCQLKVDGENLVETGSIKSLTTGFDEIEDTTEPGPSLTDVDEESLTKIVSVDSYTCDAVVDETENETEDDMVKGSDSMKDIAQLKEQIKVLQQQLYEVNIFLLSFGII